MIFKSIFFNIFFSAPPGTGILGATSLGTSIEPPSSAVSSGGNGASSILPPGGIGLGVKPPSPEQPLFMCPRRPNIGREGRAIPLRANHFQITMPRGYIHHYHISITPDKCPRKVNRDIIGEFDEFFFLCDMDDAILLIYVSLGILEFEVLGIREIWDLRFWQRFL